jgi:hypothetical protein
MSAISALLFIVTGILTSAIKNREAFKTPFYNSTILPEIAVRAQT